MSLLVHSRRKYHYLVHYWPLLVRWWVLVIITKVMITWIPLNSDADHFSGDDYFWALLGSNGRKMRHYWLITDESDHYLVHYWPLLARWWELVMITKVMITLLFELNKMWWNYKCINFVEMKSDGHHSVMAVMITCKVILPPLRNIF